jgi:protein-disulfide isomerase
MSPLRRGLIAILTLGLSAFGPALSMAAPAADTDIGLGNAKAKVTVIEYASMSCPHCARFNNETFPAFKAKYIDTGKVHYILREFLTPPIEVSAAAFIVARCAPRDKYFNVIDSFFHGQEAMYKSGDVNAALLAAGQAAGLNHDQIKACLQDEAALKALNARVEGYVKNQGINSTPTFVVNGKALDNQHEATLDGLGAAIAAAK